MSQGNAERECLGYEAEVVQWGSAQRGQRKAQASRKGETGREDDTEREDETARKLQAA